MGGEGADLEYSIARAQIDFHSPKLEAEVIGFARGDWNGFVSTARWALLSPLG